jgi:glycosyltransferase involved in cell wall biosynthesis
MFPQAIVGAYLNGLPVIVHVREVVTTYPRSAYLLYLFVAAFCANRLIGACAYVFAQPTIPARLLANTKRDVLYNAAQGFPSRISRTLTRTHRVLAVIPCTKRKGILDLIDSFVHLRRLLATTHEVHLDIVGRIDETETFREALRRIERAELSNFVRFHGEVEDVGRFYYEAHVLVHPSHTECFPRVIVEALAYSLPCIGTDVGGVSEAIEHGRNGYLVNVGDVAGTASWLSAILTSPELYASLSENAYERFTNAFTSQKLAAGCTNVIRDLAQDEWSGAQQR